MSVPFAGLLLRGPLAMTTTLTLALSNKGEGRYVQFPWFEAAKPGGLGGPPLRKE